MGRIEKCVCWPLKYCRPLQTGSNFSAQIKKVIAFGNDLQKTFFLDGKKNKKLTGIGFLVLIRIVGFGSSGLLDSVFRVILDLLINVSLNFWYKHING